MKERWIPRLTQVALAKHKEGGFKRGERSQIFADIAQEFGENPDKLKNFYYRVLKQKIETPKNVVKTKKTKRKSKEDSIKALPILRLSEHKIYPAKNEDIESFKTDIDSETDWLNYNSLAKNISGKYFENFIDVLTNDNTNNNILRTGSFNNSEVTIIEHDTALRMLTDFSDSTSHKGAMKEAEELSFLLKSSDSALFEMKVEKTYSTLKYGQEIEIRIDKIMPYGALGYYVNEPTITGMIHISEIRDGYVEDVNDYFYEDQLIKSTVIKKVGDFKLALSTKESKLPLAKKNTPTTVSTETQNEEATIASVQEDISQHVTNTKVTEDITQEVSSSPKTNEKQVQEEIKKDIEINAENPNTEENLPAEWKDITDFLRKIVGPLSPDAIVKLKELISEQGLFKLSMAIHETNKNFQNDLGVIFLEKTEKKLREGL